MLHSPPLLVALGLTLALGSCTPPTPPEAPPGPAPTAATPPAESSEKDTADVAAPMGATPEAIVSSADRTEEDRVLDAQRKPAALLAFFEVLPGQRVAELGAGGGYTTELLARAVAPSGQVFGQNSPYILQRFAEAPWSERLEKPVMGAVRRVDSEFDAPFSEDQKELDLVLNVLFYHDTVWMKADRNAMNRAIYAALKPGGVYGIVDHSAAPGAGVSVTESLHRIEEKTLIDEVTAAGFVLEDSADFLRNPADSRNWNAAPRAAADRRGQSDRFVLKFRK